jgi:hypothetical protein
MPGRGQDRPFQRQARMKRRKNDRPQFAALFWANRGRNLFGT